MVQTTIQLSYNYLQRIIRGGTAVADDSCMKKHDKPVSCYIASFHDRPLEPYLRNRGFSSGMILFAIPAFGILFKCRADGDGIDLEFAAFFSLLKFIKTSLSKEKIRSVRIHSSNPEFVFSFSGGSHHLEKNKVRKKMMAEYLRDYNIDIAHVAPIGNQALVPSVDYPFLPKNRKLELNTDFVKLGKGRFRPLQKGIKL